MQLVTVVLVLAGALYFLQGFLILLHPGRPSHVRWFGILLILLTGLVLAPFVLFQSRQLIVSREFGLIMVPGGPARLVTQLVLSGLAVAAGLSWYIAHVAARRTRSLAWVLGLGLAVGIWTATRLRPLDGTDYDWLRLHAYDLWWPPALIWLAGCLISAGLSILRTGNRASRAWITTAALAGLALHALSRPEFGDSTSRWLWIASLLVVLPATVGIAVWSSWPGRWKMRPGGRMIGYILCVILGAAGLLSAMLWAVDPHVLDTPIDERPGWVRDLEPPDLLILIELRSAAWILLAGSFALIGVTQVLRGYRLWRAGTLQLQKPSLRQSLVVATAIAIVLSLFDLLYFARLPSTVMILVLVLGLIVVDEMIGGGPITAVARQGLAEDGWILQSPARQSWSFFRGWLKSGGARAGAWLRSVTSVGSLPAAIVKTLIGLGVLIALSELPNAGKTLIQPFRTFDPAPKDIGQLISYQLFHNLHTLQNDLQPGVTILAPGKDIISPAFKFAPIEGTATGLDAALTGSSDLKIGGVEIPLGLLFAPIQVPMRELLNVRVVSGVLQVDDAGYTLLARSNEGKAWKVSMITFATPMASSVAILSEQLAFEIVSEESTLATPGMTRSWEAFLFFKNGLRAWSRFESEKDTDALTHAIDQFRAAVLKDPKFALAYYRLGLALNADGEPQDAVQAFQAGLASHPDLVAARLALASTLLGAGLRESARDQWKYVVRLTDSTVTLSDRASAYYGLCRDALDTKGDATDRKQHYRAYFFCKQAEVLHSKIPAMVRADPRIKDTEAVVLNQLGIILYRRVQWSIEETKLGEDRLATTWHCAAHATDEPSETARIEKRRLVRSAYERDALRYFKRAMRLRPDDPVIRCNEADLEYTRGNSGTMKELERDALAHFLLASRYFDHAEDLVDSAYDETRRLAAAYYRLSLSEYQQAITRNPMNWEAYNNYAYSFWRWRLNQIKAHLLIGPTPEDAETAQEYAELAVSFTSRLNPKSQDAVLARSTLGEVLLGRGEPLEAMDALSISEKDAPKHASFNEVRWDLALARICAARQPGLSKAHQSALRAEARALLSRIWRQEQEREKRPFSDRLEMSMLGSLCLDLNSPGT